MTKNIKNATSSSIFRKLFGYGGRAVDKSIAQIVLARLLALESLGLLAIMLGVTPFRQEQNANIR